LLELRQSGTAANPFPSTPVATEKYADKLGGEAWKKVREDLLLMAKRVEYSGEFGAAVLVGPPGTGKTHLCMNVGKDLKAFFPVYVDASRYADLAHGLLDSVTEASKKMGFSDFSDYLSFRTMEYALQRKGDRSLEDKMLYELKDRVFYFSFDRYVRSIRGGRFYLTKQAPLLLKALARKLTISSLTDFISLLPQLSQEIGFRVLLMVDETEPSYERDLKVLYNAQPKGLMLVTTFTPDRWAEIKDKALKDRFYSASLFRQLGYPRAQDLADIIMSYAEGYPQFTRDLVEELVVRGSMVDIRDALRKLHDAYDQCEGRVDCLEERICGVSGDKNVVSREIERYVRWQVLGTLRSKGIISYYSEKGKRIPAINSVVDLVLATDDTLYLGDVKITDEEKTVVADDMNILRASRLGGIELNGKVYQKLKPFLVTNRPVDEGMFSITLTPEEINLIMEGFNPPSIEEKFVRMLQS